MNQVLLFVQRGSEETFASPVAPFRATVGRSFAWRRPVSARCVSAPVASFENEKELFNFDALPATSVRKSNLTLRGEACLIYCAPKPLWVACLHSLNVSKDAGKAV